ncbi:hypothetical protein E3V39_13100, partial [Gammaproteobacteria bacterium LSUCC0112]
VDYFKVTANSVGALSVVFDVPTDISYASYFKLGLYDSAGTLLSSFSTGEDKTYSVGVPSVGTYYLGVSAVSTSYYNSGAYTLTASNIAGSSDANESEANNTVATADQMTLGAAITGQLSTASDVDYFKVTANSVGALSVVFDVPTDISYAEYFSISILNESGTLLAKRTTGTDLSFNFLAAQKGVYYAAISSTNSNYDSRSYSILLTQSNNSDNSIESENNNTSASANALALDKSIRGQLSSSSDLDYYSITLASAAKLRFAFDSPMDSSFQKYFTLSLIDAKGITLSSQTSGSDMVLESSVDSAGTYYVIVAKAPGAAFSASEYVLTASAELDIPVPVGAILGTNLSDIITGTVNNDLIFGNGGNDRINGSAGSDTAYFVTPKSNLAITTIAGLTTVRGNFSAGAYSDSVSKLWNVEAIQTASGSVPITASVLDSSPIFGSKGDDRIAGTSGNDLVDGLGGSDIINGEDGNDTVAIFASKSQFQVTTIAGITLLKGGASAVEYSNTSTYITNVELIAFEQNQEVMLQPLAGNAIYGSPGDDQIIGTAGNDVIVGRGGNDVINGGAGTDTLVLFAPSNSFIVQFVDGTDNKVSITGFGTSVYAGKTISVENVQAIAFSDRTELISSPPGLVLTNQSLTLSEGGVTSKLAVSLAIAPSQVVTVNLTGDAQLTSSQAQLVFTAQNWDIPQQVIVSATDDALYEQQHSGLLKLAFSSSDTLYAHLPSRQISYSIIDNDSPSYGTVTGQVWSDADRNGVAGGNEGGLAGWTVFADKNLNGKLDVGEIRTTTNASGHYALQELPLGTHSISIIQKSGWTATFPNANSSSASVISPATVSGEVSLGGTIGFDVNLSSVGFSNLGTTTNIDDFHKDPRFSGIDGKGYSVAVIDSGIDLDHPFFGKDVNLNGIADRIIYQYDFSGANDTSAQDWNGHGTHVAGIIGSSDSNYPGIAPGANLVVLKVFPDFGTRASSTDILEALNWVVANASKYNIVAVNMSLGHGNFQSVVTSGTYSTQLKALAALGVTVVSASGNDYGITQRVGVAYPSADAYSLSVGATWAGSGSISSSSGSQTGVPDAIAFFSQRDLNLSDIFAPGIWIDSAKNGGGNLKNAGTSMAAPQVAGMVVLAQQLAEQELGRRLNFNEIKDLFRSTAASIIDGDNENDTVVNTGGTYYRIDMMALANAVLELKPLLSQQIKVSAVGQTVTNVNFGFAGLSQVSGLSTGDIIVGTSSGDNIRGLGGDDVINGLSGDDIIFGDDGDDVITGGSGNDIIDGGSGMDTAVFQSSRAQSTITRTINGFSVESVSEGFDTVTGIERLRFSDSSIALDFDRNAGITAKVLGIVFGAAAVKNKEYVGIGLDLLDGGMSYEELMQTALDAALGVGASSEAVVNLLYTNAAGVPPTAQELVEFVGLIKNGTYSHVTLGIYAAEHPVNSSNIDLVGLNTVGLPYSALG